ncbi:MAG: ABC transporter substrate-binding protein [Clostridia bacterium]
MKKFFALATAAVMALSMAACSPAKEETIAPTDPTEAVEEVYTVGICQLVQHVALDAATQGFCDVLTEKLGDRVVFDEQNASGDTAVCSTIVNKFVSDKVDLILANATPALQAAASATFEIPILGTSVTEYGVALGIENFDGVVGGNISGTSDLAPLDQQADMIVELFPEAKKVALLYCSAEANSQYQVDEVAKYLAEKGLESQMFAFADSNDLAQVTEAACAYADVIYAPTDNTVASSTGVIDGICRAKKVPVIAGEEGICVGCGVATLSIDYYKLGRVTGEQAYRILVEGEDISTMAIEYDKDVVKKYNAEICEELGIEVPEDYVAVE